MKFLSGIFLIIITNLFVFSCIDEHVIEVNENLNGSIYLTSEPNGAKILLLGTDTKKVTPDSIVNLESGLYEVTLQLENYKDTSFAVQVFKNQKTTKNIKLKSNLAIGKIILNSTPANAEIFLNNNSTHKYTPDSLTNLAVGVYTIKLVLQNYIDTSFTVNISEEKITQTMGVVLKSSIPKGEIFLDSDPAGAKIFLNENETGKLTPDTLKGLSAGEYFIKLTHKEYLDTTIVVNLGNDQKTSKYVELKPLPPHGNIYLESDPIGAIIKLQGKATGKVTPDTLSELPVGAYLITLSLKDFNDTSFIANVEEDETSEYEITLVDTTSDVSTIITYNINASTGQLKFLFTFNQDIALDFIDLREPNSSEARSFPFYSQHYSEGTAAEIKYPEKKTGLWRFSISGKKLGGRKDEFKINKSITVQ